MANARQVVTRLERTLSAISMCLGVRAGSTRSLLDTFFVNQRRAIGKSTKAAKGTKIGMTLDAAGACMEVAGALIPFGVGRLLQVVIKVAKKKHVNNQAKAKKAKAQLDKAHLPLSTDGDVQKAINTMAAGMHMRLAGCTATAVGLDGAPAHFIHRPEYVAAHRPTFRRA